MYANGRWQAGKGKRSDEAIEFVQEFRSFEIMPIKRNLSGTSDSKRSVRDRDGLRSDRHQRVSDWVSLKLLECPRDTIQVCQTCIGGQ